MNDNENDFFLEITGKNNDNTHVTENYVDDFTNNIGENALPDLAT